MSSFLAGDDRECGSVALALERYGCLVVRDPRVKKEANDRFLSMMERYFEQSDGKTDARPELHYQIGVTPAFVEVPRNHCDVARSLGSRSLCPPRPDQKWRFFWRVGDRPNETEFPELNARDEVVPEAFRDEWAPTMNAWGSLLAATAASVAEMLAIGFRLPRDTFSKLLDKGPHLLAPTGSDLGGDRLATGAVLAGFHADLNFLTVHGKCRYPGLTVWRRDGAAVKPNVPDGFLLVQAGKQLEYLTAGRVLAGFHEVVVDDNTIKARDHNNTKEGNSLWRVSSTCFVHVASDNVLQPLCRPTRTTSEDNDCKLLDNDDDDTLSSFPPVKAGQQVLDELRAINL